MPLAKGNSKKKEDTAQKLKEIKQRQQNWLKQREQSKGKEESRPKVASAPSASKQCEGSKSLATKNPVNATLNQGSEIQTRFKSWLNAKENRTNVKEDPFLEDNLSIRSGAESELARLVTPEQPVAEDEFSYLAEKIASRVKDDLGFSQCQTTSARTESTDITELDDEEQTAWKSEKCKTFTRNASDFNQTSGLTSHNCIICKKIMLSSRNLPMMIIPCGHTLCRACSEDRYNCPACDCAVVSLTVNIMLQQVIQEFHQTKQENSQPPLKGSKPKRQDKFLTQTGNMTNHTFSYKSHLVTLRTRHEVLASEHNGLLEKQKQLTTHLRRSQIQASSICKQEQEVQTAIKDLQERLSALQEHREHYELQVKQLKEDKSRVDGKISMLSTTIVSLSREIDKTTLLAENED